MSDYSKAYEAWSTFHQKLQPSKEFDVNNPWPKEWQYAGIVTVTFYTSDKWNVEGDYVGYYHDHSKGVGCWQPKGSNSWLINKRLPIKSFPESAAVLGFSDGWIIERVGTGEILQAVPSKSAMLCCFPDKKTLFCLEKRKGVTAIFHGPNLHIEDRGIVG
jgi:hypothetical protein